MAVHTIAVVVGSLRTGSYSRMTAQALMMVAPATLKLEIIEIGDLAMYNPDLEATPPRAWVEFRDRLKQFDGLLFVTPEYNRSVPAALKNAIDVASRPRGHNMWDGKPGAVVSISAGGISGFGAHHHLRQMLVCLNVPTMADPEAYIGHAGKLYDEQGALTNDSTRDFFRKFMADFAHWVDRNAP